MKPSTVNRQSARPGRSWRTFTAALFLMACMFLPSPVAAQCKTAPAAHPAPTKPVAVPGTAPSGFQMRSGFDQTRFPDDRQVLEGSEELRRSFPRLGNDFEVLAPAAKKYNCISHSLGLSDRWVNPETGPADDPFGPMDRLYSALGYKRLPTLDLSVEKGKQKVVLYATVHPDASLHQVTHAAVQVPDGTWTSKLGQLPLIRHRTPYALRGPSYGLPVAVYVR